VAEKQGMKPACRRKRPLRTKSAPSSSTKILIEGEEDNFFDWRQFARRQKQKKIGQEVSSLLDQDDPDIEAPLGGHKQNGNPVKTSAAKADSTYSQNHQPPQPSNQMEGAAEDEEEEEDPTAQGGYLGGIAGILQNASNDNNNSQGGDEMTFDFKSFRSAQQDSTLARQDAEHDDPTNGSALLQMVHDKKEKEKSANRKKRSLPSRSKSAPLGSLRRPGEPGGPSFDWRQFAADQKATKRKE
jgi:hypothetical protein